MNWNKLSMAERAKYIQLGVQNGITSLSNIRDAYNSYAYGGNIYDGTTEDTQQMDITQALNDPNFVPPQSSISKVAGDILDWVPYIGTIRDIDRAYNNPTKTNIGIAGVSTLLDALSFGIGSRLFNKVVSRPAVSRTLDTINNSIPDNRVTNWLDRHNDWLPSIADIESNVVWNLLSNEIQDEDNTK